MTPPQEPDKADPAVTSEAPAAVSLCPAPPISPLKNRPDFLRAASARRQPTGGFLLQARARGDERLPQPPVPVGDGGPGRGRGWGGRGQQRVAQALQPCQLRRAGVQVADVEGGAGREGAATCICRLARGWEEEGEKIKGVCGASSQSHLRA